MKTAQKTLQLLDMLSGIRRYTAGEIRERLQLSERGLYRYIKVLKDFGFVIDKDERGYILEKNNKAAKEHSSKIKPAFHYNKD